MVGPEWHMQERLVFNVVWHVPTHFDETFSLVRSLIHSKLDTRSIRSQ